MALYPIVSTVTGATVAATTTEQNARATVAAMNRAAGREVARVGDPIPGNPAYGATSDALSELVAAAAPTI